MQEVAKDEIQHLIGEYEQEERLAVTNAIAVATGDSFGPPVGDSTVSTGNNIPTEAGAAVANGGGSSVLPPGARREDGDEVGTSTIVSTTATSHDHSNAGGSATR